MMLLGLYMTLSSPVKKVSAGSKRTLRYRRHYFEYGSLKVTSVMFMPWAVIDRERRLPIFLPGFVFDDVRCLLPLGSRHQYLFKTLRRDSAIRGQAAA